jgi:hypothetical protein
VNFTKVWGPSRVDDDMQMKFNASEDDAWNYTSQILNFTVERDDVLFMHMAGNGSNVSRVGTNSTMLMLRAFDNDTSNPISNPLDSQYYDIWVTTNGSGTDSWSMVTTGSEFTNSSGHMWVDFDPESGCLFSVGPQDWKGGISIGAQYYQPDNSSLYNMTITSAYFPTVDSPINVSYERGVDDIPLLGNLTDYASNCGLVPGADVRFGVIGEGYECAASGNGSGWYNCTIPASVPDSPPVWSYGWYNITMNATMNYYPFSETMQNLSFYLASRPVLSNPGVDEANKGWGKTWTFDVDVTDSDGNNVTVQLWKRKSAGDPWELLGTQYCQPCSNTQLDFIINFTCSDVDEDGSQYFFNATDTFNYNTSTSPGTIFVNRDAITLIFRTVNNVNSTREGNATTLLSLEAWDFDRSNEVLGAGFNGTFYVTTNGTDWGPVYNTTTNASGYLNLDFNASCTYEVGSQKWMGGIENDGCYATTSSSNRTLYVYGQLKNNLFYPINGTSFDTGTLVNLNYTISSDCSNEGNLTGVATTLNLSSPTSVLHGCDDGPNDEGDGWYNCSFDTVLKEAGWWDVILNSSNPYYFSNSTTWLDRFSLVNAPTGYQNISVTPDPGPWGGAFNYSVNVSDVDQDNVNCSLYISTNNGSSWQYKGITTIPNGSGICYFEVSDLTCSDISNDSLYYFSLDDGYNIVNTTNTSGPNITRDQINIIHIFGDNEDINRTTDGILLTLFVNDTVKSSGTVPASNITFNVTTDGSSYTTIGYNTTNSSGYAIFNFTPSCSFNPMLQKWLAYTDNNTCYYDDTTAEFNLSVWAHLTNSIQLPNGSEYLRQTNVTFRFNVTDDCSNMVENASTNITTIHEDSGANYYCNQINNESGSNAGWYNCTFNTSGMPAQGYSVQIFSNRSYYNTHNLTHQYSGGETGFFIETEPVLTLPQLNTSTYDGDPGENGSWSEYHNFTILVTDDDGDSVTVYWYKRQWNITASDWTEWEFIGNDFCAGNCNQTQLNLEEDADPSSPYFPPGDLGLWSYKANATDDSTSPAGDGEVEYNATTLTYNYTIEKDDMTIYHYYGNGEWIWRNGSDSIQLSTRTFSVDQNSNNSGVNSTVWITKNHTDFEEVVTKNSVSQGYLNYTFNPNGACEYDVGIQYWKMGSLTNDDYKDTNSSDFTIELRSYLSGNITGPSGQAYQRGQVINITWDIYDECNGGLPDANSTTIYLYSDDGLQDIISGGIQDLGNGSYYYEWDSTGEDFSPFYNITIIVDKDYYTSVSIDGNESFSLGYTPELQTPQKNQGDNWGDFWSFSVQARDLENDDFNISLWKRATPNNPWELVETQTITSNKDSWQSRTFQGNYFTCSDVTPTGWNSQFKFNATDQWGFSDETSPPVNFTILRDNVETMSPPGSG